MRARLGAARQAGKHAARAARPWPSVEKPTVRTDRPDGMDAVRYASVNTATHRLTVTHHDTQRDEKETARMARIRSQGAVSAGGGRCWVRLWPPSFATRPCAPASRKPRTGERLVTDGRDGSGYADRPPTRFPCPAGSATAAGPAPPGAMTRQGSGTQLLRTGGPLQTETQHGRLRHLRTPAVIRVTAAGHQTAHRNWARRPQPQDETRRPSRLPSWRKAADRDARFCRRQGLPDCHGVGTSVRRCMPHGVRHPDREADHRSWRSGERREPQPG